MCGGGIVAAVVVAGDGAAAVVAVAQVAYYSRTLCTFHWRREWEKVTDICVFQYTRSVGMHVACLLQRHSHDRSMLCSNAVRTASSTLCSSTVLTSLSSLRA